MHTNPPGNARINTQALRDRPLSWAAVVAKKSHRYRRLILVLIMSSILLTPRQSIAGSWGIDGYAGAEIVSTKENTEAGLTYIVHPRYWLDERYGLASQLVVHGPGGHSLFTGGALRFGSEWFFEVNGGIQIGTLGLTPLLIFQGGRRFLKRGSISYGLVVPFNWTPYLLPYIGWTL